MIIVVLSILTKYKPQRLYGDARGNSELSLGFLENRFVFGTRIIISKKSSGFSYLPFIE